MQSMFKKLLFLCFFVVINQTVLADNFKLEKLTNLNQPWSLTFINENEILISEKSGSLILYNKKNKKNFPFLTTLNLMITVREDY